MPAGLLKPIHRWAVRYMIRRPRPDMFIGGESDPYLLRWWILPRNRFFNIYLHRMLRSDDDRALHDHPWANVSLILSGPYLEYLPGENGGAELVKIRRTGDIVARRASQLHRLALLGEPTISLFITGPRVREWGFQCPQGWRPWQEFVDPANPETIGPGCD